VQIGGVGELDGLERWVDEDGAVLEGEGKDVTTEVGGQAEGVEGGGDDA
jgi:hypothetical protein